MLNFFIQTLVSGFLSSVVVCHQRQSMVKHLLFCWSFSVFLSHVSYLILLLPCYSLAKRTCKGNHNNSVDSLSSQTTINCAALGQSQAKCQRSLNLMFFYEKGLPVRSTTASHKRPCIEIICEWFCCYPNRFHRFCWDAGFSQQTDLLSGKGNF